MIIICCINNTPCGPTTCTEKHWGRALCKLVGSLGMLAPSITDPGKWNVTSLTVKELAREVEQYQLHIIGWTKWLSMVKSIHLMLGYSQAPG